MPGLPASAWAPRAGPGPGPGRSTEDPTTPTRRELARRVAVAPLTGERVHGPSAADDAGDGTGGPPLASARLASVPDVARAVRPLPGGTCGGGWGAVNVERDRVLAAGGPADDAIGRNGAISAVYARYYERNPSNQWAGLAAIVSRQAGCAMAHARETMEPVNHDYYYRQLPAMRRDVPAFPPPAPTPDPVALGAMTAYDGLATTNRVIFADLYPVLRFEEEYGADALGRCGPGRPGSAVDPVVTTAVRRLRDPDPRVRELGGGALADYEQRRVVQRRVVQRQVLRDPATRAVFDANQRLAGTAAGRLLGARPPEVALTAGCDDGRPTVPFEGRFVDRDARVAYYRARLVPAFRELGADRVRAVIGAIAGGP